MGSNCPSRFSTKTGGTNIDDFVNHFNGIAQLMQSMSIKELLNNLTTTLKRIFKVTKVSYFVSCKDTIDQLRTKEGASLK